MTRTLTCTLALLLCAAAARAGEITGKVDATPAKYLEDTVVYVEKAPGTFKPRALTMDQKGMTFLPRILLATAGDTVTFLNNDKVDHNVYTPDNADKYNLGVFAAGKSGSHLFAQPGVYTQLCSIHPEMLAYVFVGQNPYAAVVGKDGSFKITGVPAGTHQVAVWNPKLKAAAQSVTVADGKPASVSFSVKR
jgi:plastocyanin